MCRIQLTGRKSTISFVLPLFECGYNILWHGRGPSLPHVGDHFLTIHVIRHIWQLSLPHMGGMVVFFLWTIHVMHAILTWNFTICTTLFGLLEWLSPDWISFAYSSFYFLFLVVWCYRVWISNPDPFFRSPLCWKIAFHFHVCWHSSSSWAPPPQHSYSVLRVVFLRHHERYEKGSEFWHPATKESSTIIAPVLIAPPASGTEQQLHTSVMML